MTEHTELQRRDAKTVIGVAAARAVATVAIWAGVAWTGNVIIAVLAVVATMIVWALGGNGALAGLTKAESPRP